MVERIGCGDAAATTTDRNDQFDLELEIGREGRIRHLRSIEHDGIARLLEEKRRIALLEGRAAAARIVTPAANGNAGIGSRVRVRDIGVGEVAEYGDYRLCYVRGPEGILIALAEQLG